MGGSASAVQSLWSPEEELHFKKARAIQKRAAEYVIKNFFDGTPTRTNKHSMDPLSPVFVQPDDNHGLYRAKMGIDNKFDKVIPTTVMLGPDGLIRVIFMEEDITYNLSLFEIEQAVVELSKGATIPGPNAPLLHEAYQTSMDVYWKLPYPAGIIQAVEVQYASVYSKGPSAYKQKSDRHFRSSRSTFGSQWLNWTQKRWSDKHFLMNSLDSLDPGTGYTFRMRYKCTMGWSEYSDSSPMFKTKADVPSKPKPVVCVAKTPNSALISWLPPQFDNGSSVIGYVLEGRAVGDDFVELYSGMKTSFIVFSLFPEYAYSFRVAAVNEEGRSLFSDLFNVQTPPRLLFRVNNTGGPASRDLLGASNISVGNGVHHSTVSETSETISPVMSGYEEAMSCRQAWKECWDDRSQSFFYFNMMTGLRQRDKPEVWDQQVTLVHRSASAQLGLSISTENQAFYEEKEVDSTEALKMPSNEISEEEKERQKENKLRSKKFGFYKALRKFSNRSAPSNGSNDSHDSNDGNTTFANTTGKNKLLIHRQHVLTEAYKYFVAASPSHLRAGRLQIEFDSEEGIDSGGISKEFFLIVSKLAKKLCLHSSKQYIIDVQGKIFFKNRIQRSSDIASMKNPGLPKGSSNFEVAPEMPKLNIGTQILSSIDGDEQEAVDRAAFCYFLGRLVGKALYDRQFIDISMCPILWKHLLTMPVTGYNYPLSEQQKIDFSVSTEDLKVLDETLHKSLLWMMNNTIDGIVFDSFSVQVDESGETVPLCKNGENIEVTDDNKSEYVNLIVKWRTEYCVKTELDNFVRGFCEIIPRKVILDSGLGIEELNLILNGKNKMDVEEIRAYTIYQSSKNDKPNAVPFGEHSENVGWLWMLLRKLDFENQGKFLLFVTGTSCIPLDGYNPPFNVTDGEDMAVDSLPKAHTCFNQIVLPPYSSYEVMREKILFGINNTEGFALT